jgi:hypothetical protein
VTEKGDVRWAERRRKNAQQERSNLKKEENNDNRKNSRRMCKTIEGEGNKVKKSLKRK